MKKIIFILFVFAFSLSTYSQTATSQQGRYVPVYFNNNYTTSLPMQKTAPKGSVYLAKDWKTATIVLRDSSYITNVKANYNFYSKYVEILQNDTVKLLNFSKVDWLIFNGIISTDFYENGSNFMLNYPELGQCDFVQVLARGNTATFIDKLGLDLIAANYNTAIDAGNTSDTYVLKHEYFVIKNNELIKIRKTKGSVLSTFSDKKDELKIFIKNNKLKMKNPKDIAQVVNYYNSLYEQSTN
ncbi:MAG: hypothetical protein JXR68_05705 [Bacteroidales bacterium]|nr:hypothetical protein [Bacteroidales bacterium]